MREPTNIHDTVELRRSLAIEFGYQVEAKETPRGVLWHIQKCGEDGGACGCDLSLTLDAAGVPNYPADVGAARGMERKLDAMGIGGLYARWLVRTASVPADTPADMQLFNAVTATPFARAYAALFTLNFYRMRVLAASGLYPRPAAGG